MCCKELDSEETGPIEYDENNNPPIDTSGLHAETGARSRLLVIAYDFPSSPFGSAYRAGKYMKLLPKHGWDITVLTVSDDDISVHDYGMLEEVFEAGVQIERVSQPRMFGAKKPLKPESRTGTMQGIARQMVFRADYASRWRKAALERAVQIIERGAADVIYAFAPPVTAGQIALELHNKYGTPVVLDLADSLLEGNEHFHLTPLHRSRQAGYEEELMKATDAITVANRKLKEYLVKRYPYLGHERIHIIPDGYDGTQVRTIARYAAGYANDDMFRIGICQSMLDADPKAAKAVFSGVAQLLGRNPVWREQLKVCIIGNDPEHFQDMAKEYGIASAINIAVAGESDDVLRALFLCDTLLCIAEEGYTLPAECYQYIGTRKPVIALSRNTTLLRQTFASYKAISFGDWSDESFLISTMGELFERWGEHRLPTADEETARQFDQRKLSEQLSRVLGYALRI